MVDTAHVLHSAGDPTAEQLLAACAVGDRAAFRALYDQFKAPAYGLALRVLRDEQLAQDALQEAFMQVWTQAGAFDAALASARSWILTLVHRRAVDRVRREMAEQRRGAAWAVSQAMIDHDTVAEIVELHADHRHVRVALNALTAIQRQAVELAYVRGLTQSQIAAHLDLPLGTVKTRLRDGLQRLRKELEVTA